MPMATWEEQREYQRQWQARRRAAFFADKACVDCGSIERLELDHVDPATKTGHAIWSWTKERREAEIAKCVIRCRSCHIERHAAERRRHGTRNRYQCGCRCDPCKAAKARNNRKYRESRRRRDSDPRDRICSPAPNHSATSPEPLTLFDLREAA